MRRRSAGSAQPNLMANCRNRTHTARHAVHINSVLGACVSVSEALCEKHSISSSVEQLNDPALTLVELFGWLAG
ncbi:unnamed protein product [Strongylus vulgaris]|uniref:Uncharacterized protein n=1 Tax=Strongylus vulgaris TaxID=40348 RepID=A0A3P7LTB9_STRVU|nr:unnamed protein product [Strongylus vulgaris]